MHLKPSIQQNKESKKLHDQSTGENLDKYKKDPKIISPVRTKRKESLGSEVTNGLNKVKIDDENNLKKKRTSLRVECELPLDDPYLYIHRENQMLIHHYGPDLYECSMELEKSSIIGVKFLSKHVIDPCVRTKMVDWMIEVLYAYNSDPPTFFLAVHLMDLYIWRTKNPINNNDIHLIGVTCLYLASKMEDIIPLRMSHVKTKISHNKFSEKEIKKCEKNILESIDFEIITTSTYDFIKTFIFDFCHNNRHSIKTLNMSRQVESFERICVFLAKMMCHSDEFSVHNYSLKAIASIIAAFDILRSNSKNLKKEAESFMRDWVFNKFYF